MLPNPILSGFGSVGPAMPELVPPLRTQVRECPVAIAAAESQRAVLPHVNIRLWSLRVKLPIVLLVFRDSRSKPMASTWDEEKKKCPWYVAARKISECCREPMSNWQDRQHHGPCDCAWQEHVLHGAQHDDRVRLSLQVLADSSNKEAHGNSLKPATLTIDTRNSTSDNRLVKTSGDRRRRNTASAQCGHLQ